MQGSLHVLAPESEGLFVDALRVALDAAGVRDVSTSTLGPIPGPADRRRGRRDDLHLVAASANGGDSVGLTHVLRTCIGARVLVFDAPDDPAFSMAAFAAGALDVLPRTTSWETFRDRIRRHMGLGTAHDPTAPGVTAPTEWHEQRERLVAALDALGVEDRAVLGMSLRGVPLPTIRARTGRSRRELERAVASGHRALGAESVRGAVEAVLRHGLFEVVGLDGELPVGEVQGLR